MLVPVVVFAWSLVEAPLEIFLAQSVGEEAAILFSKGVLGFLTVCVVKQIRAAELSFMFICLLSILAIAPQLVTEIEIFPIAFWLSFVECIFKATAFLTLVRKQP